MTTSSTSDDIGATPATVIGYYVHHHGGGHAARFESIRRSSRSRLVPLSQLALTNGVRLPPDAPSQGTDETAGGALHWAPVDEPTAADRLAVMLGWLIHSRPTGVVVDVSVEAALLFRLAGTRTIVVRQHGDRDDRAHQSGYRSAARLLAPFPAALEHASTPDWIVDKTVYTGFISPTIDRTSGTGDTPLDRDLPSADDVVVLWGRGGGTLGRDALTSLAHAAGGSTVWVLGDLDAPDHEHIRPLGFVDQPQRLLVNGPVVVASAGNNAVADAARHGCALVVCPQRRPFREQQRHAESLLRAGAAAYVSEAPTTAEWASALCDADDRRSTLGRLAAVDGAAIAARLIDETFTLR